MKTLTVLAAATMLAAKPASAEPRIALVLGVAASDSPATPGDADSVANVLSSQLGFQVIHENNVSASRMSQLLVQFSGLLRGGGTGLFYYAGHGAQINNVNYLMPAGTNVQSLDDVKSQWIKLDEVTAVLSGAPLSTRLIFLDACRDNPLLAQFASSQSSDTYLRGLARPGVFAQRMMVSFATSPNNIALSGSGGRDDWYTAAFNKFVTQAGLNLDELMQRIGDYVDVASDGSQVPWAESSIRSNFYFRPTTLLYAKVDRIDDELVMLVNGKEGIVSDGPTSKVPIDLHVGPNRIIVQVYNQRSYTGGIPYVGGHLPEGWTYTLRLQNQSGQDIVPPLTGGEDRPADAGPHHGHIFTVATATAYVDEITGTVSIKDLDADVWKR